MPDDNLGIDPNDQSTPNSEGEGTAPAAQPDGGTGLTADNLQSVIADAIATNNQPVVEAVQQLGQALGQMQQAQSHQTTGAVGLDGARGLGGAGDDAAALAERLLTDPQAVLSEQMNLWARDNLAAPLGRSFEADRDERVEARAAEIDLEMGEGYFEANVRDRLTGAKGNLATFPLHEQANPKVIDAAISAILGNDFRDPERRATMTDALTKTAKAREERQVTAPPNMMGPGRSATPRSDKLTPDMTAALEGFKRAGIPISEQGIKNALNRENTLEGWRAQQAARKGATQ